MQKNKAHIAHFCCFGEKIAVFDKKSRSRSPLRIEKRSILSTIVVAGEGCARANERETRQCGIVGWNGCNR
jgi:hypothetical protein